MLGGYYFGQEYLGISGWTDSGTLTVRGTNHSNTADNIALIQQHVIVVDNTTHSWIAQNNILAVDNTMHTLVDTLSRIINLADYNYFSGIYIKDFGQSGYLREFGSLYAGTLILQNKNIGLLEPTQIDSGVFVKSTNKQGQLN